MKKRLIAAAVAAASPLVLLGAVGGFETGAMPWWGLLLMTAVCLYGEWWGLSTMDGEKEDI
jgi:hypothetical protein